ncbi:MAG: OsmC family protein [Acidobacteriota bacterium]|nr:OsmC family protein [Acidobacteriota bacterium]
MKEVTTNERQTAETMQPTAAAATPQIVNGVNVDEYFATIDAVNSDAEIAAFTFRAANKWVDGGNNRTTIRDFYGACQEVSRERAFVLEKDEPPILLGTDRGANPVEYALAALAGCLTTTLVYHAAAQGVRIKSIESSLEGNADLRGFLGLNESVRNGLDKIRVRFRIESDAPREKIQELVTLVQNRSGVFDMLNNGVPVAVELE